MKGVQDQGEGPKGRGEAMRHPLEPSSPKASSSRRFPPRAPDDLSGSPRSSRIASRRSSEDDLFAMAASHERLPPLSRARAKGKARMDSGLTSGISVAGKTTLPSFAESQFATIVRRQRKRRIVSPMEQSLEQGGAASGPGLPPRLQTFDSKTAIEDDGEPAQESNATSQEPEQLKLARGGAGPDGHARRAWEFAGWGSMSLLELPPESLREAREAIDRRPKRELGQWRAAAIAGNAITGSVFYSLPAVLSVAGVYSPISLFIACVLIGPFRPILVELTSALGATDSVNYSYFSNLSTRGLALVAAAITAMDALATGAVSASTAASYLEAETGVGAIPWTIILLVALGAVALLGLRDSSSVALGMLSAHVATMAVLIVAGIIFWARQGTSILGDNWRNADIPLNGRSVARSIVFGIALGFVGLTGFETTPSYVTRVKEGQFARALVWLQITVLLTEAPLMLLCLVAIPTTTFSEQGGSSANILALLGEAVGGSTGTSWLRILVVIDAVIVLSGGIITGIVSFGGLFESLANDYLVPRVILRKIPKTGAAVVSIVTYIAFTIVVCATSGFNLATLSSIFSLSFLVVMSLFPLALLLIKHNRPTLPRKPTNGLIMTLSSLCIGIVGIALNIALGPKALLLYVLYLVVCFALLWTTASKVDLAKLLYWTMQQNRTDWLLQRLHVQAISARLVNWIRKERRHPVIYFTKTDELSVLIEVLSFIRDNDHTSHVLLVHCFESIEGIPSELEANFELVDEAFPQISVDLIFVENAFSPEVVQAVATKLNVGLSRCFISCPSSQGSIGTRWQLIDFGGVRIISD